MFDLITLGSLPRVFYILLNRPINIYPGIGGVIDMELEECMAICFISFITSPSISVNKVIIEIIPANENRPQVVLSTYGPSIILFFF